jgi:hypothetical protein
MRSANRAVATPTCSLDDCGYSTLNATTVACNKSETDEVREGSITPRQPGLFAQLPSLSPPRKPPLAMNGSDARSTVTGTHQSDSVSLRNSLQRTESDLTAHQPAQRFDQHMRSGTTRKVLLEYHVQLG